MRGVAAPAQSGAPAAASPLASYTPSSGPAGGLGGLFPGVGAPRSGRPSGLFGAGFPELEQVEQVEQLDEYASNAKSHEQPRFNTQYDHEQPTAARDHGSESRSCPCAQ